MLSADQRKALIESIVKEMDAAASDALKDGPQAP